MGKKTSIMKRGTKSLHIKRVSFNVKKENQELISGRLFLAKLDLNCIYISVDGKLETGDNVILQVKDTFGRDYKAQVLNVESDTSKTARVIIQTAPFNYKVQVQIGFENVEEEQAFANRYLQILESCEGN